MPEIINKYLSDVPVTEFSEEIQNTVTDSHTTGTDKYLDKGGDNEVSAAHIREVVDAYQVKSSPSDPFGVIDDTVTDPKLGAWQQTLAKAGEVVQNNINLGIGTIDSTGKDHLRKNGVTGGSGAFEDCCVRPDGYVVFAPYSSNGVGLLSPDGLFRRDILHNQGATANNCCCYWKENDVTIFCPHTSTMISRLNADNTFESFIDHGQGNAAFMGCSPRYDGKIIFTPYHAPAVGILNEDYTFTITEPHGRGATNYSYQGKSVQRADGSMVFPPHYSNDIGILNPDNSFITIPHGLTTSYKCMDAILRPDNVVVFVPTYNNPHILLLYPDNSVEVIQDQCWSNASYSGFSGGLLLPNGDVLFIPYYNNLYGVFHMDNTYSTFPTLGSTYYNYDGCLRLNGDVIMSPYNGAYGETLDLNFRYNFDKEFLIRR